MTIFKDETVAARLERLVQARTIITNLMKGGLSASALIEIIREVEEMLSGDQGEGVREDQSRGVPAQLPKPGEGQNAGVREDHTITADARSPMPEGQIDVVQKDQKCIADGQSIASGETSSVMSERTMPGMSPARDTNSEMLGEGQAHVVREDQMTVADARQPVASGEASEIMPEKALQELPPAREPRSVINNQAPSADRMRAVREAGHSSVATIFDRFKCPDQITPIGAVRACDLQAWANSSLLFASLFRKLGALAVERGKLGPRFTVKDILSSKELERVIADSGVVMEGTLKKGVLIEANGTLTAVRGAA